MYRVICSIVLFVVLPLSAQDSFVTLDWQELPPVRTLPMITEDVPLPDDFRFYSYDVKLEFPEFAAIDQETVDEFTKKKVELPETPCLTTHIGIADNKGYLSVSFIPVVFRDGVYQRIQSFKLALARGEAIPHTRAMNVPSTKKSILSSGRFVKIRVHDSGIYQITHAELKNMGFTNPDKVRLYGYGGYLLSQEFVKHPADDLPEVPLYRKGETVLFYARGVLNWIPKETYFIREQNFYSDYGYYFLTQSEDAPARFQEEEANGQSANRINTFNEFALYEKDVYSWADAGRELYDGYDFIAGNTQNYNFKVPDIVAETGMVTVDFSAKSPTEDTFLGIAVDGKNLGRLKIEGTGSDYEIKAKEAIGHYLWTGSDKESVTVTLTHERSAGVSGRLNYLALNYQRRLRMSGAYLSFRSLASVDKETTFVLSGANSSTVIWDVTSPVSYKQIKGKLTGDTYMFTIPASSVLREFVAVNTDATFARVENRGEVPNQNLHSLEGIDMVIIVSDKPGLQNEAERLAQFHREKDRLNVQVATATEVYNEFSSGTPDVTAYRRLMKMLFDRGSSDKDRPKYLLLFGDASYDNRLVTPTWSKFKPEDFLLVYESENSVHDGVTVCTDDYLGFLDDEEGAALGSGKLDIGIGRIPVRTVAEARGVVDKTIRYMENKETGAWKRIMGVVTDHPEPKFGLTFMDNAVELIDQVTKIAPFIHVERVFPDAYKQESSATGIVYPQAIKRLSQLFEQGMLVVNYIGHSSPTVWSETNLLTSDDIVKLSSPRLPLWVTASCEFTRFDAVGTSAGEFALLNEKGGAIALFTTTRSVSNDPRLNQAFIKSLFDQSEGKRRRLGDAVRLAKRDYGSGSNKLNFTLIGDPALTLNYPDYEVQIEEFDGPLTEEVPFANAGGKVKVKGHILTPDGELADDFTGTIHPLVLDSEESMATLGNTQFGVFAYEARTKTLFSGTDSVRNGHFEFTFPMPLDINYSDKSGLLNIYACDSNNREAGGTFDGFLVGGTASDLDPSDTDGPAIRLYLNTPDFPWGGQVNETPYFVAELKDEDGINTVGSGIGHDLSLCIDGKITYPLNDYYIPVSGSYTEGKVAFSIPELSEGRHTLTFRAWDIKNNSSVKQLDFEVVKGLRPDLFSIICSNSPARGETTFILSHDRPGSILGIPIAVWDFSGRELWVHNEEGVSDESYYYVDWNLCSSEGQRLAPGVYLFRASITSEGSKESTKTEKIVILAQ